MNATELVYLSDMQRLEMKAHVVSVDTIEAKTTVILDRTIFYPQGGGQPADRGTIRSVDGVLEVNDVRSSGDAVLHLGTLTGSLAAGAEVDLRVDAARRELNTRVHSAGHVVDMAVQVLGLDWMPGKAYHFPEGPYVEYLGELDPSKKDQLQKDLEIAMNEITSKNIPTSLRFVPHHELASLLKVVPPWAPVDKPCRVVFYGDFGVPCGGTHVANLRDVGKVTVRKMKASSGTVRVAYGV